jgi:hypothetical protein
MFLNYLTQLSARNDLIELNIQFQYGNNNNNNNNNNNLTSQWKFCKHAGTAGRSMALMKYAVLSNVG